MIGAAPRNAATAAAVAMLDFLLPRVCVACDRPTSVSDRGMVCGRCWSRIALLAKPQCTRCGHPHLSGTCHFCVLLPPYVRSARSLCWVPDPTASRIVAALKYHGWSGVGRDIGERLARLSFPPDVLRERAVLVPVPLNATRERDRGYNQSLLIAEAVSPLWGIPVAAGLVMRIANTETQTRLTPGERSANIRNAFASPPDAQMSLRGKHLVLVDDVLTTGATLNECASVLFEAGARTISYLTFGRARSGTTA